MANRYKSHKIQRNQWIFFRYQTPLSHSEVNIHRTTGNKNKNDFSFQAVGCFSEYEHS